MLRAREPSQGNILNECEREMTDVFKQRHSYSPFATARLGPIDLMRLFTGKFANGAAASE
jgi:hypothetical protein